MDEVVQTLKLVLVTAKTGTRLDRVNHEYYEVTGERIPYRRFNFNTLEDFLNSQPNYFRRVIRGGEVFYYGIASEKSAHIADMVKKQRTEKRRKKPSAYAFRRPLRSPISSNQRSNYSRPQFTNNSYSSNARGGNNSNGMFRFPPAGNSAPAKVPQLIERANTATNQTSPIPPLIERPNRFSANTTQTSKIPPLMERPNRSPPSTVNQTSRVPSLIERPNRSPPSTVNQTSRVPSLIERPNRSPPSTVNVPTLIDRPNRFANTSVNQTSQMPPMMERPNVDVKLYEPPARAKSNLQNRLNVNRSTEPVNNQPNLSVSPPTEAPKTVFNLPIMSNRQVDNGEVSNKFQSQKISSIVPFEEFNKKPPQLELEDIAKKLNYLLPSYKLSRTTRKAIFAVVTVGEENYSSYPQSAETENEAKTIAATKALEEIKKHQKPSSVAVTRDKDLIKERILQIIDSHTHGVFSTQIMNYYVEIWNEVLPDDWFKIIQSFSEIYIDTGADNTKILKRYKPTLQRQEPAEPPVSPLRNIQMDAFIEDGPGKIQVPDDSLWPTHVTAVYGTDEVWLRIVGDNYGDEFFKLTKKMNEFYSSNAESMKVQTIQTKAYYVVLVDDDWHRVQCVESNPKTGQTVIYFIDHGDQEICHCSKLFKLHKQFCKLPAQAIRVSLFELEEFADWEGATSVLEEYILEQTLYVEEKGSYVKDSIEIYSAVFYDTSSDIDVNLNEVMFRKILDTCIPKPEVKSEGAVQEVFISHVSETGDVFVQFRDYGLSYVRELLNNLIEEKLDEDLSEFIVKKINLTKMYLIKSPDDGSWLRVQVLNVNYLKSEVTLRCADFGNSITSKISNLIELEKLSKALACCPPQAVQINLHELEPAFFTSEKIKMLKTLAPPSQSLLMRCFKRADENPAVVTLFKRQESGEIISINDTLLFDTKFKNTGDTNNNTKQRKRSERSTNRRGSDDTMPEIFLKKPNIPNINENFNVYVTLVCNPGNFHIQPFNDQKALKLMNNKLQAECANYNGSPLIFENLREGMLCAARHSNGQWHRARILHKFTSDSSVSVYFCDYGEIAIVHSRNLQPLHGQFFDLPYQAIRAKLAGVKPLNGDWSGEDCIWFKELIENTNMMSTIRDISTDGETILTLELNHVPDGVSVGEILIRERRAIRI